MYELVAFVSQSTEEKPKDISVNSLINPKIGDSHLNSKWDTSSYSENSVSKDVRKPVPYGNPYK